LGALIITSRVPVYSTGLLYITRIPSWHLDKNATRNCLVLEVAALVTGTPFSRESLLLSKRVNGIMNGLTARWLLAGRSGAGKSGDSPTPVLVRLVISVSFHPLFHHLMIWLHLQLPSPINLYILREQASRDDSPHKAW
jgi:hypothetical protein